MQIVNFDKKKIGNGCGRDLNLDRGKQKNNVKINGTLTKSLMLETVTGRMVCNRM